MMHIDPISSLRCLPPDDVQREALHNEVHARPQALIPLPMLIVYVAVMNEGVDREQERAHLACLPGHGALEQESLKGNFLRLQCEGYTVKWERHSEFTRYSIVQPLAQETSLSVDPGSMTRSLLLDARWLSGIPGQTIAAIQMVMLHGDPAQAIVQLASQKQWFAGNSVVASLMGSQGHSCAVTDFALNPDGFERMVVIAAPATTQTRAGRIAQRLLELETYRLMALRGLPLAKDLGPLLSHAENELADITAQLENKTALDQQLLDALVSLAAKVERATAHHVYRFSATRAYDALVSQRIGELREKAISGTQTIGEFMQRRLSPAMSTVAATAQRLASLSERVSRTSALLRTRVDIATEVQNQQLLEKLTRGQELQLRLQSTVEGLSIAAISYYVVSLLLYGAKALKGAGVPLNPEVTAGAFVPLVLWGVWATVRKIHRKLVISPP